VATFEVHEHRTEVIRMLLIHEDVDSNEIQQFMSGYWTGDTFRHGCGIFPVPGSVRTLCSVPWFCVVFQENNQGSRHDCFLPFSHDANLYSWYSVLI